MENGTIGDKYLSGSIPTPKSDVMIKANIMVRLPINIIVLYLLKGLQVENKLMHPASVKTITLIVV